MLPVLVVVPCHNDCIESTAVARRLAHETYKFGALVVVVADRCRAHTESHQDGRSNVWPPLLVSLGYNTEGKVGAINVALQRYCPPHFSPSIVVLCDADTNPDPGAVTQLIQALQEGQGVAAMARMRIFFPRTSLELLQAVELENQVLDHLTHGGRTDLVSGQTCALVRGQDTFLYLPGGSLVEDQTLTYQLRSLHGDASCLVIPEAKSATDSMKTWRGWWAQRRKWHTGTWQELFRVRPTLAKRTWSRLLSTHVDLSSRVTLVAAWFVAPSLWYVWVALLILAWATSLPWRASKILPVYRWATLLRWELYLWSLWLNLHTSLVGIKQQGFWESQQRAEAGTGRGRDWWLIPPALALGAILSTLLAVISIPSLFVRQLYRWRKTLVRL